MKGSLIYGAVSAIADAPMLVFVISDLFPGMNVGIGLLIEPHIVNEAAVKAGTCLVAVIILCRYSAGLPAAVIMLYCFGKLAAALADTIALMVVGIPAFDGLHFSVDKTSEREGELIDSRELIGEAMLGRESYLTGRSRSFCIVNETYECEFHVAFGGNPDGKIGRIKSAVFHNVTVEEPGVFGNRRHAAVIEHIPLICHTLTHSLDAEGHGAVRHIIRRGIVDRGRDALRLSYDPRHAVASGAADGTYIAYVVMGMRGSRMSAVLKAGAAYGAVMLGPFPVVHTDTVVTAVILAACDAALETEKIARIDAILASHAVVEADAAILAEVAVVIGILHAESLRAFGIALTAVKTDTAELAHINLVVAGAAIGAEMLLPIGRVYAVFAAGTALALGVVDAALGAKSAIGAEFKIGASGASFTILAEEFLGAIGTMRSVSAVLAPIIGMLAAGIAMISRLYRTFGAEVAIPADLADTTFNAA